MTMECVLNKVIYHSTLTFQESKSSSVVMERKFIRTVTFVTAAKKTKTKRPRKRRYCRVSSLRFKLLFAAILNFVIITTKFLYTLHTKRLFCRLKYEK